MDADSPFSNGEDSNRTIILPMPGRRGRRAGTVPEQQPVTGSHSPPPQSGLRPITVQGSGRNPLVNAATALFVLVGQLRSTTRQPNVIGLRERVIQEVKAFESAAQAQGTAPESVLTARYALCTLIDETVLSTPWGSESTWLEKGLLSTFHNETWGGEKFFAMLERLIQAPARNVDLLELFYICLAFGFEGKYRVLDRGRAKLEEIQDNLFRTIRSQRGDFERELSVHWQGVQDQRNPLARYVPLWVVGAIACAVLLTMYVAFRVSLSDATYPVFEDFAAIGKQTVSLPKHTDAPVPVRLLLSDLLRSDIEKGLIVVDEDETHATVRIGGDGLFESGNAVVEPVYRPLLARIGDALDKVPGQVLVIGHTDNVPIRSLRFQSNWELSRARAVSVISELTNRMQSPGRLRPEGRADTEPLVPNDTPANRARNRRVDITLLVQGTR
jgi:type VI secretion system protein ImpK